MLLLLWGCGHLRPATRVLVEKHSRVLRARFRGASEPSYPRVTTPYTRLTRAYIPLRKRHPTCGLTLQPQNLPMGRDPRRAEKCDGWQQNSANARNRRRLRSSSLPTPAFLGSNGKAEARPSRPACTLCDCFSALKQIVQSPKLREGPVPERGLQEIGKPGPGMARPFALASGHDDSSLTYQRARGPS